MKITKALRITIATTAIATAAFGTYISAQAITGGTNAKPEVNAIEAGPVFTMDGPTALSVEATPATDAPTDAGTTEQVAAQEVSSPSAQPSPAPSPIPSTAPAEVIYPPQPDGTPTTAGYYQAEVSTFEEKNKL